MNEKPLVSVVVSSYNHEKYIATCLQSILEQTYPNLELIVIDDGSGDDTPNIVADLAGKHSFQFIAKDNEGLSKTLNQGLSICKGEYFVPFGSDDVMLPGRIEKQVELMQSHPDAAASGGNVINIDQDGNELKKQNRYPYRELTFENILLGDVRGISAPTAMIKSAVLRDGVGGYNPDIPLEDVHLWLKLTDKRYKIVVFDDVFACYRRHGENTSSNLQYMLDSMRKTLSEYSDHPLYSVAMNKYLISMFITASKQNKTLAKAILGEIDRKYYWKKKVMRGRVRLLAYFLASKMARFGAG